jgi:hypothetical protein
MVRFARLIHRRVRRLGPGFGGDLSLPWLLLTLVLRACSTDVSHGRTNRPVRLGVVNVARQ